jgi:hypothetical protein
LVIADYDAEHIDKRIEIRKLIQSGEISRARERINDLGSEVSVYYLIYLYI